MGQLLMLFHPGAPGAPFVPSDAPGLVSDLDADAIAQADNTAVATWTATVGPNMAQGTGGNQPTLQTNEANGHSVVRFAADDYMDGASALNLAQPSTIYIVCKVPGSATEGIYGATTLITHQHLYTLGGTMRVYAGSDIDTGVAEAAAAFAIYIVQFNGASSKFWKNGGAATAISPGAQTLGTLRFGANQTPDAFLNGDIARFLAYSGVHTLGSINNVGAYLGTRYGPTWSTAS